MAANINAWFQGVSMLPVTINGHFAVPMAESQARAGPLGFEVSREYHTSTSPATLEHLSSCTHNGPGKTSWLGLERLWMAQGYKSFLLLQRARIQFPIPTAGCSQPPVNLGPGHPCPLLASLQVCGIHPYKHKHITIVNKHKKR